MLRHIPKFFPPDAVKFMMEMGHSDYLVIADAFFEAIFESVCIFMGNF